jgi:uncharacterized protein
MGIARNKPVVACPQCGKEVEWEAGSPYRPFCSRRCKLIDLGQWASENYRIAGEEPPEDDSIDASDHA